MDTSSLLKEEDSRTSQIWNLFENGYLYLCVLTINYETLAVGA